MSLQAHLNEISAVVGEPVQLKRYVNFNELAVEDDRSPHWPPGKYRDNLYGAYSLRTLSGKRIATFNLIEFPACGNFCISCEVMTYPNYRSLGINKIANRLRQYIAHNCGYVALLCTANMTNEPERRTLKTNGWDDLAVVKRPSTPVEVVLSIKKFGQV